MSDLASGCSGLEVGPARPSLFFVDFSLRVRVREAHAAAFHEQREAEQRLQPRESRPLEFCHDRRVTQSYHEDVRARVPSTLNFSNIIQYSRVLCRAEKGVKIPVHPLPPSRVARGRKSNRQIFAW